MEKQALSRQLSAVKAIAAGDDDMFDDLGMDELETTPEPEPQAQVQAQTQSGVASPIEETPAHPVVELEEPSSISEEAEEMSPPPAEPEATPTDATDDEPTSQTQPIIRDPENTL